ncbi:zinc ribbon domain-containing protein [Anaeromassilibacillus sp. An250]|uniref:zinc ribbon domain-containing protein n=1 Tax=Anaeromassilibacillus sp. An250 TaxID=1965604 RepID=UPI000B37159A|nr:zinc ribbon domain-containing protein [Anaeromassilibacillus sp. An250]OUO75509.1 hypothetical protein B5F54_04315 [Anaeromassilibacillus sp. An250]
MTLEEAIMANYSQKAKKIKTPFAKMIVEGNQEKPYFSILYFDPIDKDFYVGYSSYCLDYVSNWLNEEFEIVEDENFIIAALRPVSREQVEKVWRGEWVKRHKHRGGFRRVKGFDDMGEQHEVTIDERCEYDDLYCSKCGKQSPDNFLNFCGYCGAPVTDEAVEMVMERLEELKNEIG